MQLQEIKLQSEDFPVTRNNIIILRYRSKEDTIIEIVRYKSQLQETVNNVKYKGVINMEKKIVR